MTEETESETTLQRESSTLKLQENIREVIERETTIVKDESIPPELLAEWKDAFQLFDKDHDGNISYEELSSVMRVLGNNPTDEDLHQMMKDIDADSNGQIDFEEFTDICAKYWKDPVDEEKELTEAFKVFDRNNDGFVDTEEIMDVMRRLGKPLSDVELEEIMAAADHDRDGKLNYTEFVGVMTEKL